MTTADEFLNAAMASTDSNTLIDSTHAEAIQYNDSTSSEYDLAVNKYPSLFGCTNASTGAEILIVVRVYAGETSTSGEASIQPGCSEMVRTVSATGMTSY